MPLHTQNVSAYCIAHLARLRNMLRAPHRISMRMNGACQRFWSPKKMIFEERNSVAFFLEKAEPKMTCVFGDVNVIDKTGPFYEIFTCTQWASTYIARSCLLAAQFDSSIQRTVVLVTVLSASDICCLHSTRANVCQFGIFDYSTNCVIIDRTLAQNDTNNLSSTLHSGQTNPCHKAQSMVALFHSFVWMSHYHTILMRLQNRMCTQPTPTVTFSHSCCVE